MANKPAGGTAAPKSGSGTLSIQYATAVCCLGHVLAATTQRGLCAILLGDDPQRLHADLAERFPRASIAPAARDFDPVLRRVVCLVEAPGDRCDLPLDLLGTAFQLRVWAALRQVPAGQTTSYAEVAGRLHAPRAARAVAQACAANPVAVAVPCHRVLRSDGTLSGYRWGIERKQQLLHRERKP